MRAILPLLALPLLAAPASPQDWPSWRGPNHDGSTEAEGLPTDFDRTRHVKWVAELPGPAASTPIVHGDRVFVTSTDAAQGELVVLCLERTSGEVLWRRKAGSGYRPGGEGSPTQLHPRSNYASPSPVTDGRRVVCFFGNGDLVAYDLAGERLWARNLQEDYGDFAFQWTFSASPTLWQGMLFLPVLQRDEPVRDGVGETDAPSFLLAMDPATGETKYEAMRPSDAQKESLESYATAIPWSGGGRAELVVVGGDVITGHDPATGKELWRWGTWNEGHREQWWRVVPSVVCGGGVALVCAPKREPVYAVRLGGSGDLGEAGLAWKSEGRPNPVSSDVPTPLFYRGKFYVLSDVREALSRVNPADGKVEWTIPLDGRYKWRSSPTGADGKIWCMNHAGEVLIVNAEDGAVIGTIAMGEEDDDSIRSTIVVAHGDLFIRTNDRLYCVGK